MPLDVGVGLSSLWALQEELPPRHSRDDGDLPAAASAGGSCGTWPRGVRGCHVGWTPPSLCPKVIQDHHCAPDLSFGAHTNPKKGYSISLGPQGLDHPAAPPASPLLLHCWGHTTLDADMEAPAVLPCRASGQAGVQASISHLHSQEREKLRHKKKTQAGRKKAELLPQCSQCGGCSHFLTRARALPAAVHPSPR